jgi:hypothetical protein
MRSVWVSSTLLIAGCLLPVPQPDASCGVPQGAAGASCQHDCDCLSLVCDHHLPHDCFTGTTCGTPPPPTCAMSQLQGACEADSDCASQTCQHGDAGTAPGACCGTVKQQCAADADCCDGLQCATDNTGCRLGPTPECVIDGGHFASQRLNPLNDCQYCDPYTAPSTWTNLGANGAYMPPCGDGGHPGGIGPGINYCCNGRCTDTCP